MSTSMTRAASRPTARAWCRPASLSWLMPSRGNQASRAAASATAASEALQRALARVRDLEQGIELRQLEERLQVVIQIRQPQFPTLLANLLRQRYEHAQSGAVDVSRLREVNEKLLLAPLQLVQHFLFQFL